MALASGTALAPTTTTRPRPTKNGGRADICPHSKATVPVHTMGMEEAPDHGAVVASIEAITAPCWADVGVSWKAPDRACLWTSEVAVYTIFCRRCNMQVQSATEEQYPVAAAPVITSMDSLPGAWKIFRQVLSYPISDFLHSSSCTLLRIDCSSPGLALTPQMFYPQFVDAPLFPVVPRRERKAANSDAVVTMRHIKRGYCLSQIAFDCRFRCERWGTDSFAIADAADARNLSDSRNHSEWTAKLFAVVVGVDKPVASWIHQLCVALRPTTLVSVTIHPRKPLN
ncbi:hypothetical protein BV22DRAFT_1120054 [Leucogyrophana mollusca]|uniref:Uncharacterized protein n=1 Tax=Leucogyrophana mollusca TaxID=85980 RepID=A0ACB8BH31_9AGAM|nr:hypothetical protein BV22DRAFT_1120054 [Leucogyrophana mollusca]